jgi:hypothetical protein
MATGERRETAADRASAASYCGGRDGGASGVVGRGAGETAVGGGRRERGGCRDPRRAVPTLALSRGVGAARGGHAAVARC